MSGEFDELAATVAGVLIDALRGDSAADAEQWFAGVIGQPGRLAATRAELAAVNGGPARESVVQAQVSAWTVRLRDALEDNPVAARTLRELVDGLRAEGLLKPASARSQPAAPVAAQPPTAPLAPVGVQPPVAPAGVQPSVAPVASVAVQPPAASQPLPVTSFASAPPPTGPVAAPPGEPAADPGQEQHGPAEPAPTAPASYPLTTPAGAPAPYPPATPAGAPASYPLTTPAGAPVSFPSTTPVTAAKRLRRSRSAAAGAAPTAKGLSKGAARGLIAAGTVLVVAVAAVVSWQAGLFGGGASPQLRPLGWTGTQAPLPSYAVATSGSDYNELIGISCPASGTCLGVGEETPRSGGAGMLIERFSGGTWTPEQAQPPLPAGAEPTGASWLNYIACSSPTACTAVGAYSTATAGASIANTGLVETLSGTTWTPASVPLPPDAGPDNRAFLDSVGCPAAGGCVAVGVNFAYNSQGDETSSQGQIATENGSTWTSSEAPLPADAATASQQFAALVAVSCSGPGACTAVGTYRDKNGNSQGLIDTLANGTWKPARAPLPKGAVASHGDTGGFPGVELGGVSCASGTCAAVGNYRVSNSGSTTEKALIETLSDGNASSAKPQSLPLEGESELSAVSCVSAGSCLAVGGHGSNLQLGLAATLVNGTWSAASVSLPANAVTPAQNQNVPLWGVACPGTANCEAVGGYTVSGGATVPFVAAGTSTAAATGTAAAVASGSAAGQPGLAGLPLGQGTFQIRGTVTEFDPVNQSIELQGTVDGLALTATAKGNGLAAGGFNGQGGYCGTLGLVGSSASGALGGVPFTITLTGCSGDNSSAMNTATYTGTWGSRAVDLTLTTNDDSQDFASTTLSGTIGSQQVSGVPAIVPASGAPGLTATVSGTITVS